MFDWFRRKKQIVSELPVESREKAIEYQQVAGLLCMDIDLLVDCCECDGMTKDDMLWQIRDLRDKKDEITVDKEAREGRYTAAAMLFSVAKSSKS